MYNREKLEEAITASGLRKDFLAKKIGISINVFYNKLSGTTRWKYDEVITLCKQLHINAKDRKAIFFNDEANVIC